MNFNAPAEARTLIEAINTGDRFIIAFTRPGGVPPPPAMGGVYLGANAVTKVYAGANELSKVYVGTSLVFSG